MLVGSDRPTDRPTDRQCHLLSCPGQLKTDVSELGMDLKSQIQSTFKLSGLTVRIEASKYLAGLLAPVPDDDRYANIVMSFVDVRHGII